MTIYKCLKLQFTAHNSVNSVEGLLKGAVNTHKDEQRHRQERKLSHAPAFNVLKEIVKTRTFPEKI